MDENVKFLRALFADQPGLEAGIRRLLAHCKSIEPSAPWAEVEGLDFGKDQTNFFAWASRNLPEKDEHDSIQAFYFGIPDDGGSVVMDGTEEYDETDETCDWACASVYQSGDDWDDSVVLGKFQTVSEAYDSHVPSLLYVLCLGYVSLLVQHWAPLVLWKELKREAPVAVGFQSGDAYVVLPRVTLRDQ